MRRLDTDPDQSPGARAPGFTLVVGGARSGKSDFAVGQGRRWAGSVWFVATADVGDDRDLAARVERHRDERPATWPVIEAPTDLVAAIETIDASAPESLVIVDCLTVWASNLMFRDHDEAAIVERAGDVARLLAERSGPSIVVSNEVGLGVHPATELGRTYRDVLGRVNRAVADVAARTLFFAAGRAVELHDPDRFAIGVEAPAS